MRGNGQKLAWITSYDFPSAFCAEKAGIDMLLVGDSGAMVQYGKTRTSGISMDLMIEMTKAVRVGAPKTLIVGDMPRGAYEVTVEDAVRNALRFAIEGSTDFVKLEGASSSILNAVEAINNAGIPVIGHLGLTPQSLGTVESYKVVGKQESEIRKLKKSVFDLISSGASCILLEAVPPNVADALNKISTVPLYGIGAGPNLDGQLLIYHDLIGYFPHFRPKFAHQFATDVLKDWPSRQVKSETNDFMSQGVGEVVELCIRSYIKKVKNELFPAEENCYASVSQTIIDAVFN
jgi:3-methyl-2-oxobutanoate hydroxymethyltransferase